MKISTHFIHCEKLLKRVLIWIKKRKNFVNEKIYKQTVDVKFYNISNARKPFSVSQNISDRMLP
jgi:hypothetical protein